MIKPVLDQLYIYALLYDAPANVKDVLLNGLELDTSWNSLCEEAEKLALGGNNTKSDHQDLYSIFSIVNLGEEQPVSRENHLFNRAPLTITEDHFPRNTAIENKPGTLWKEFLDDLKKLAHHALDKRSGEFVLQLLFKYASTIPCGRKGYDTVSFYDLARLRAGIAIALAQNGDEPKNEVLLVGGDISGIQRFLYDIVSKNASRNLKGRSFYLYLLVNNVIDVLLKRLQLYTANIAFDSGGNFLLIAPNTEEANKTVEEFERQLSKKLFAEHRTTITCSLGSSVLNNSNSLSAAFSSIHEQQREKKDRPYLNKVLEYVELFEPDFVEEGGRQARDVITGEELSDASLENTWFFDPTDEEDLKQASNDQQEKGEDLIGNNTAIQIILGQRLKQFEYWIKSTDPLPELNDLYIQKEVHIEILGLGVFHYLLTAAELQKYWSKLEDRAITISAINNFDLLDQAIPQKWQWHFHLYGGNQGPTVYLEKIKRVDKSVPKTFSEMAGALESDRIDQGGENYLDELKFKRLGVLRMDVDNLGQIFRIGIPTDKYCLATYCNLSRSMDFFFKGYLNQLWLNNDRHKHTQIIYAGGDDLFIVGRWDKTFEFAKEIKSAFAAWTNNNASISISGGMVVVTHKYPIMKAALMAGEAEDKSKAFEYSTKGGEVYKKNAFSIFDYPLRWSKIPEEKNWSNEFELLTSLVEKLTKQLIGYGKSKGLPISMLRNIHALYQLQDTNRARNNLSENQEDSSNKRNEFAWQWQAAYTFSQMEKRLTKDKQSEGAQLLRDIKQGVLLGNFYGQQFRENSDALALLALVARLAELERRTKNESAKETPSRQ